MTSLLAPIKPREHALWGWLCAPLLVAALLAPSSGMLASIVAVVSGFAATNALGFTLRRGHGQAALVLSGVAAVSATLAATSLVTHPGLLGGVFAGAGALGFGAAITTRGRYPHSLPLEAVGLALMVGVAALVALSAGADEARVAVCSGVMLAWLLLGIWWVNRGLSAVLPMREPHQCALPLALGAVAGSLFLGTVLGHIAVGALPLLYAVRVAAHAPPASPRDARRTGFTELAWMLAVAILAAVI